MPGPFLPDQTPAWLKPENASVTESPLVTALRHVANFLGANSPEAQMMTIAAPMEIGGEAAGGIVGQIQKFIKAYHGSPHDFPAFSAEKIGTGEGAQAYGHGLYFAENPAVAQDYARTLSQRGSVSDPNQLAQYFQPGAIVNGYGGLDRVVEFRPETAEHGWSVKVQRVDASGKALEQPRWHATPPSVQEFNAATGRQGMYDVAIHANPEQFLDWDKPLNAQSPEVQQAIAAILGQQHPNLSGAALYDTVANQGRAVGPNMTFATPLNEARAAASGKLQQAGIPGIKYLDQGSRAAGKGSRNYVVFDDKLVEILKKYGFLPPIAGAATQLPPTNQSK
jgi:hypothetical protein